MAYLEVLEPGFTISGGVHVPGDVVFAPDFTAQSKAEQVKRWGRPMYKEISENEFKERGGQAVPPAPEVTFPEPPEQVVLEAPEGTSTVIEQESPSEFADLDGLNMEATLSKVATFDDEKTARFIVWEKAHANRKGVLGPLGADVE